MKFILINGEAQVGKSTWAKDFVQAMAGTETYWDIEILSVVAPVQKMLAAFATHLDANNAYFSYQELKQMNLAGRTGREWMIMWADAMRADNEDSLIRILFESALNASKSMHEYSRRKLYIVENLGMLNELRWFENVASSFLTVHLDTRATRSYANGEQFDNDNRFCLRDLCEYVNPEPKDIATLLKH